MKPRDIFKLAVRILGLIFLYHGLSAAPMLVTGILGGFGGVIASVLTVIWPLAVAFWLLSGAPLIMRIAYPDSEE